MITREELQVEIFKTEVKLNLMLSEMLKAIDLSDEVETTFNREYFRFDFLINENHHQISLQGRGNDIDKYKFELLEIVKIELANKQ